MLCVARASVTSALTMLPSKFSAASGSKPSLYVRLGDAPLPLFAGRPFARAADASQHVRRTTCCRAIRSARATSSAAGRRRRLVQLSRSVPEGPRAKGLLALCVDRRIAGLTIAPVPQQLYAPASGTLNASAAPFQLQSITYTYAPSPAPACTCSHKSSAASTAPPRPHAVDLKYGAAGPSSSSAASSETAAARARVPSRSPSPLPSLDELFAKAPRARTSLPKSPRRAAPPPPKEVTPEQEDRATGLTSEIAELDAKIARSTASLLSMHHDPEIPAIVAAHVAHDSPSAGWAWPADWTRIDDPRHTPESREAAHAYLAAVQRKKAADFALARIRAAASSLSGTGVKRMANASTSKAPTASRAKAQRRLTGPNHSLLRGLNASSSSSAKGKEKASEWTPGGLSSTTRRHRNSLELLKMFLAEREGVSPLEAARRWLVPGCRAQLARGASRSLSSYVLSRSPADAMSDARADRRLQGLCILVRAGPSGSTRRRTAQPSSGDARSRPSGRSSSGPSVRCVMLPSLMADVL